MLILSSKNLKKCSACKHMFYCDAVCQKEDWKRHKFECKIYKEHYDELRNLNMGRFLLRLYLFLSNNKQLILKKEILQFDESIQRSFEDLMTHKSDIEKSVYRTNFEAVLRRFNNCNIEFDAATLFEYYCKICINSFSILNNDLNDIGSALYVEESFFDHSCTPNAAPVSNGMYLEVRAIKEIKHGEKITINYVDLKDDLEVRRKSLNERYYFDCHCPRCTSDFDKGLEFKFINKFDG